MTTTAAMQSAQITPEAETFTKRIGYTTYRVGVHFSGTNTETVQDKIMRFVKTETQNGKGVNP